LKIVIVAVAHKPPSWVKEGFAEYAQRMPAHARVELVEVKPEAREGGKTPAQMMALEAKRIEAALPRGAQVVALDERGSDFTTQQLATRMQGWMESGNDLAFVIGGPDGLDAQFKARAHARLRLSALTLPHALVRVVLAEALYRASSVLQGHPYHRE
jgi:23S rRNA (pseudouridine1915-N3)-methyltransferase